MNFVTYYSSNQLFLIGLSALMAIISMFFFKQEKILYAVLFLMAATFFTRYLAATLDPFLNCWDEQYHALVGKNLSDNLLKPFLIKEPYLPYDYKIWGGNHVWVHKQPWFLWQIALSIKLFGVNEIAVRIPSAIMSTLLIWLIYRIGCLVSNKKIAWYSAFLFAFCHFQINMVTGNFPTDHNDIAFMFYITCSIWCFFEYLNSPNSKKWIILIGVFSGIAILNKWLVGLVVFAGWFTWLIASGKFKSVSSWKDLFISVLITVVVALPWQLYIFYKFPAEAAYEFEYNSKHFGEVIEGHGGTPWFHFEQIVFIYGRIFPYILVPGMYLLFKQSDKKRFVAYFAVIAAVYLFFTMAQTKMWLFTMCISPLVFISFGAFLDTFVNKITEVFKWKLFVWYISLIVIGALYFDTEELERKHSERVNKEQYLRQKGGADLCKQVAYLMQDRKFVVFNTDAYFNVEFMFYTGQTGYSFIPQPEIINELKNRKMNIAVFYKSDLPDYILRDKNILILPKSCFWVFE